MASLGLLSCVPGIPLRPRPVPVYAFRPAVVRVPPCRQECPLGLCHRPQPDSQTAQPVLINALQFEAGNRGHQIQVENILAQQRDGCVRCDMRRNVQARHIQLVRFHHRQRGAGTEASSARRKRASRLAILCRSAAFSAVFAWKRSKHPPSHSLGSAGSGSASGAIREASHARITRADCESGPR